MGLDRDWAEVDKMFSKSSFDSTKKMICIEPKMKLWFACKLKKKVFSNFYKDISFNKISGVATKGVECLKYDLGSEIKCLILSWDREKT